MNGTRRFWCLLTLAWSVASFSFAKDLLVVDLRQKGFVSIEAAVASISIPDPTLVGALLLSENKIEKISGLDRFTNLKILDLRANQIRSLENIAPLPSVEVVDLTENKLASTKGVASFPNARTLDLGWNPITDLVDLTNLKKLWSLSLMLSEYKNDGDSGSCFKSLTPLVSVVRSVAFAKLQTVAQNLGEAGLERIKSAAGSSVEFIVFWNPLPWFQTDLRLPEEYRKHYPTPEAKESSADSPKTADKDNAGIFGSLYTFVYFAILKEYDKSLSLIKNPAINDNKSDFGGDILNYEKTSGGNGEWSISDHLSANGKVRERNTIVLGYSTDWNLRIVEYLDENSNRYCVSINIIESILDIIGPAEYSGYYWRDGSFGIYIDAKMQDGKFGVAEFYDNNGNKTRMDVSYVKEKSTDGSISAQFRKEFYDAQGQMATSIDYYDQEAYLYRKTSYAEGKKTKSHMGMLAPSDGQSRFFDFLIISDNFDSAGNKTAQNIYYLKNGKVVGFLANGQKDVTPIGGTEPSDEYYVKDFSVSILVEDSAQETIIAEGDTLLGRTPISLNLQDRLKQRSPGEYSLKAKLPGYADAKIKVDAVPAPLALLSHVKVEGSYDESRICTLTINSTPTASAEMTANYLNLGFTGSTIKLNRGDALNLSLKANGLTKSFAVSKTDTTRAANVISIPFDAEARVVSFESGPSKEATIKVSGTEMGVTPVVLTWYGKKTVEVAIEKNGIKKTFSCTADEPGSQTFSMELDAEPRTISVITEPLGAKVSINGKSAGFGPVYDFITYGPSVNISVSKANYRSFSNKYDLKDESSLADKIKLKFDWGSILPEELQLGTGLTAAGIGPTASIELGNAMPLQVELGAAFGLPIPSVDLGNAFGVQVGINWALWGEKTSGLAGFFFGYYSYPDMNESLIVPSLKFTSRFHLLYSSGPFISGQYYFIDSYSAGLIPFIQIGWFWMKKG